MFSTCRLSAGLVDVGAAVADAEVELAVGAEDQAVQVVAEEGVADAVAGGEDLLHVGPADVLGVAQGVEAGDAGVVDVAVAGQDARAQAVGGLVEPIGEDGGLVRPARAGGVLRA